MRARRVVSTRTLRASASWPAGCFAKGWLEAGWERRLEAQADHRATTVLNQGLRPGPR
jgi:hypothetical protein